MEELKGMYESMTELLSAIIFGPCEKFKTKLFQRWGMVGGWIYLLYGVYLINYNPSVFYDHGVIGSYYQAGLGVIMILIVLSLPLIIIGIIANFLTKEEKKAEVGKKIEKTVKKYELPIMILFSILSILTFLMAYSGEIDYIADFQHKNEILMKPLVIEIIMIICGSITITPILYLIELLTWDIIKSDIGGNE